jgi:hypothetical protein
VRRLGPAVVLTLAVAWCAPSQAVADRQSAGPGTLLTPQANVDGLTGGEAMGQAWHRVYALPAGENPAFGRSDPCVRLGHTHSILLGLDFQAVPCVIERAPRSWSGG